MSASYVAQTRSNGDPLGIYSVWCPSHVTHPIIRHVSGQVALTIVKVDNHASFGDSNNEHQLQSKRVESDSQKAFHFFPTQTACSMYITAALFRTRFKRRLKQKNAPLLSMSMPSTKSISVAIVSSYPRI